MLDFMINVVDSKLSKSSIYFKNNNVVLFCNVLIFIWSSVDFKGSNLFCVQFLLVLVIAVHAYSAKLDTVRVR